MTSGTEEHGGRVTGASRGIGRQIALEFGRRGSRVVVAARTVEPRRTLPGTVAETVHSVEEGGGSALAVQCDVANQADLQRLVATTIKTFGRLDVVVNNAGDMVGHDFEALIEAFLGKHVADQESPSDSDNKGPIDAWLHQFAVNVHAPYLLSKLATPHMQAQGGGVIVNISSEVAHMVPLSEALEHPSLNPSIGYPVTKAALNRLTNALAASNIAVVAVDPGVVRTEAAALLGEAGVPTPAGAVPMSVPVATVMDIVTADDPMAFSGRVIVAEPVANPSWSDTS
jgi:NAD(P)-dependent dehydrogenase (short-subunit alcohol dehydrogenase family)